MERKVFAWIVRRLRWFARIPGMPHIFDAALFAATALLHPARRKAMEELEVLVTTRWPCVLGTHRFGGSAYCVHGREIAHLHGNGLLDVRLTRRDARDFIHTGRAAPHHFLGDSAWVSYWLESSDDLPRALDLIQAAAARNEVSSATGPALA
jgi:hypothetical protein